MNKVLMLLISAITLCTSCQNNAASTESTLSEQGIKGDVKSIETTTFEASYVDGHVILGVKKSTTYEEYNEDGNIISSKTVDFENGEKYNTLTNYTYDGDKLVEQKSGNVIIKYSYKNNLLVKEEIYDNGKVTLSKLYEYKDGKKTKVTIKDHEDGSTSYTEYEYIDENGSYIQTDISSDGSKSSMTETHDENGRLISIKGETLITENYTLLTYNEHGDVETMKTAYTTNNRTYEYDVKGNWTKETSTYESSEDASVDIRKINYNR